MRASPTLFSLEKRVPIAMPVCLTLLLRLPHLREELNFHCMSELQQVLMLPFRQLIQVQRRS
jgi:hypothetical protein